MSNIPKTIHLYYNNRRTNLEQTSVYPVDPEKSSTVATAISWSGGDSAEFVEILNDPMPIELLYSVSRGYNGKVITVRIAGRWTVDFRVDEFMEAIQYGSAEKGVISDMVFAKVRSQMKLISIHGPTYKKIKEAELVQKASPTVHQRNAVVVGRMYATKSKRLLCISNSSDGYAELDGTGMVPAPCDRNVFVDMANATGKYSWIYMQFSKSISAEETWDEDMDSVKEKLLKLCIKTAEHSQHLSELVPCHEVTKILGFGKELEEKLSQKIRGASR